MSLPDPFYQDSLVTLYRGDCEAILPSLPKADLLLTDPPYGIGRCRGMGGGGRSKLTGMPRTHRTYEGGWDKGRPSKAVFDLLLASALRHIIWGGNYFSDFLPVNKQWLVWDKETTMPSYSDAELAWTSLRLSTVKMFRYCGNGFQAKEKERVHPTQKPVALFGWCLELEAPVKSVIDPFAGSGTTGRACKDRGIKCTLIEREESYCEIAARRCQQEVLNFAQ